MQPFSSSFLYRCWLPAAALALSPLSGCTWLFGQGELPLLRDPVQPAVRAIAIQHPQVSGEARFEGVGQRMVTAKNIWGRAARAVNPYGADTLVVTVTLKAAGDAAITVLPERATLRDGTGAERQALTLGDMRRRWPTWAIATDEQEADRKVAYEAILDTLWIERALPQGATVTGKLAFPRFTPHHKLILKLPIRKGLVADALQVEWGGL